MPDSADGASSADEGADSADDGADSANDEDESESEGTPQKPRPQKRRAPVAQRKATAKPAASAARRKATSKPAASATQRKDAVKPAKGISVVGARDVLPAASTVGELLKEHDLLTCKALAEANRRFDLDGHSSIYRGDAINALSKRFGGERHAIHPIGADLARSRGLYNDGLFAMWGMVQPTVRCPARSPHLLSTSRAGLHLCEPRQLISVPATHASCQVRQGLGICIGRNAYDYSRDDIGKMVRGPDGSQVELDAALVDSGLDALHRILVKEADGHHEGVKALERADQGSHGVWKASRVQIMRYKVFEIAQHLDLPILVFDFGNKSRCTRRLGTHMSTCACSPIVTGLSACMGSHCISLPFSGQA